MIKGKDRIDRELDKLVKIVMKEVEETTLKKELVTRLLDLKEVLKDGRREEVLSSPS